MKVTLTPNITRYDNKMRLRMDKRTARILAVSAMAGILVGFIMSLLLSSLYSIFIGAATGLVIAALCITEIGGIPMLRVLRLQFKAALSPIRLTYTYQNADTLERLTLPEDPKERNDPNHETAQRKR